MVLRLLRLPIFMPVVGERAVTALLRQLRAELDELRGLRARVLENQAANPHLSPRPEVLEAIDRQLPRLEANIAEEVEREA